MDSFRVRGNLNLVKNSIIMANKHHTLFFLNTFLMIRITMTKENVRQILGTFWDQEAGEKLLGATRDTETAVQQEG